MQNIIQLKTLDNSLEWSQMYDALEDTPRDFQTKLIDALNSLGETMQIPPTEAFNKVLCKSDDKNEGLRKKLYNWWRAFFEVLGKVVGNAPADKSVEFNQKMDDLMAEIMKAGDAEASTEEEPVMESDDEELGYEQATKEDEDKMMADMDFAIQHLGEIANKVKAIVNFINPYCEKTFNEENNTMKFKKIDEGSTEWVDASKIFELAEEDSGSDDIVDHMMELGSDPDFIVEISGNKVLSDGAVEFQCIYKRDSSAMEEEPSDVKDLIKNEVEGMLDGTGWGVRNYKFPDDDDLMISWDSDKEPYAAFKVVVEQKKVELENANESLGADLSQIDWDGPAIIKIFDPDNERDGFYVNDGECDWNIQHAVEFDSPAAAAEKIKELGDDGTMFIWPAHMKKDRLDESDLEKKGEPLDEYEFIDLMKDDDDGDVFTVYDGTPMVDGSVCLNVIVNKDDTDNEEVKAEFGDWVEQYGWRYESFSFSSDLVGDEGTETIHVYFRPIEKKIDETALENELDKGDDGWTEIGQPVGESKPVELESGATKKVSLYVDWDDDGAGIDKNVVIDVPAEIADSEESTALYDYITDWIDHQDFCVNDWAITDIEGLSEISENNDEVKSADVKDGDKQVTQDGETKTLVAGEENKKPVCEMTIEQEIDDPWKLSEMLWSQGKENLEELLRSELVGEEEIMQMLEDTGVRNLTNINDLFAFDFPSVLDSLGLDGQAWSKNLEIKPQGDDSEGGFQERFRQ